MGINSLIIVNNLPAGESFMDTVVVDFLNLLPSGSTPDVAVVRVSLVPGC